MAELHRERHGEHIALWTVQAEARRNTLTKALVQELIEATRAADDDPTLRAVVLTGQGDKAFCAGADLKESGRMSVDEVHAWLDGLRELTTGFEASRLPFIAALNGAAFGGGTEIALACDLRVAVESCELALTEVTLARIPGAGGTQRLPRLVGFGLASELVLTGRRIGAREALGAGLVNRVVPVGQAAAEALVLAETLAGNGPLAVAAAKEALQRGSFLSLDEGLKLERAAYEKILETKDRAEGILAFQEKRKPVYRGE